jgi:energy-converting hydrogenase Eha subunit C
MAMAMVMAPEAAMVTVTVVAAPLTVAMVAKATKSAAPVTLFLAYLAHLTNTLSRTWSRCLCCSTCHKEQRRRHEEME